MRGLLLLVAATSLLGAAHRAPAAQPLAEKADAFRQALLERHLSREGLVLYRVDLRTIARDLETGAYPDLALNYLPPVKRDAVDAFFQFPAGTNMALADEEVAKVIVSRLQPYMDGEKEPALLNYYLFSFNGGNSGAPRLC